MYTYSSSRSLVVRLWVGVGLLAATGGWLAPQAVGQQSEGDLRAILRSAASPAEKALACKHLAVYGSSAAVAELAPLLRDEQLASWARIALEVIPGSEVDSALRDAAKTLDGRLAVGAIHSLGVRRDSAAVSLLVERLADRDVEVAGAAAYALGRIGDPTAAEALRSALDSGDGALRNAAAEACVVCAEQLAAGDRADLAEPLYEAVRRADVPAQRKLEATRGLIVARGPAAYALLREQLTSSDKAMVAMALGLLRELPGGDVDRLLSADIAQLEPERAVLLIQALADRSATVDRASLLEAATRGPSAVRLAAIQALGRVGDAACVESLLDLASDADAGLAAGAHRALAELPDPAADREMLNALKEASGPRYRVLLSLVGERRLDALAELERALTSPDGEVRQTALAALGQVLPADRLIVLVDQLVAPAHAEDAPAAAAALKVAAVRMPDREACGLLLANSLTRAPDAARKVELLEILGAVGGRKALDALHAAAQAADPQLQDASTRLLGEWMSLDAAPVLLDLARSAAGAKYQTRALRGYIRLVRQFNMSDDERVAMCRNAWNVAEQIAEKKLVLQVLERYPLPGTLELALQAAQVAELKQEATQIAARIAHQLGTDPQQLNEMLTKLGLPKVAVEILRAEYGAGAQRQDVTKIVRARTRDSQMIVLASRTYNEAFGGDPLPGVPKELTIKFKLDGKEGEAKFPENALILLPVPK